MTQKIYGADVDEAIESRQAATLLTDTASSMSVVFDSRTCVLLPLLGLCTSLAVSLSVSVLDPVPDSDSGSS